MPSNGPSAQSLTMQQCVMAGGGGVWCREQFLSG